MKFQPHRWPATHPADRRRAAPMAKTRSRVGLLGPLDKDLSWKSDYRTSAFSTNREPSMNPLPRNGGSHRSPVFMPLPARRSVVGDE